MAVAGAKAAAPKAGFGIHPLLATLTVDRRSKMANHPQASKGAWLGTCQPAAEAESTPLVAFRQHLRHGRMSRRHGMATCHNSWSAWITHFGTSGSTHGLKQLEAVAEGAQDPKAAVRAHSSAARRDAGSGD